MPVTIKHARIVVVFDLCSSSQIMEDLLLSDKFDRYEAFLTCVKRWLMNWTEQHSPPKGRFELYKFTGDGWILLFPDTISGEPLIQFMYSLCEMINAELARHIIPSLSSMPRRSRSHAGRRSGKPDQDDDERARGIRWASAEHRMQAAERRQGQGTSSRLLQGACIGPALQRTAREGERAVQGRIDDVLVAKHPGRKRICLPEESISR